MKEGFVSMDYKMEFEERMEMNLYEVSDLLNDCGLSRSLVIMDNDRFAKLHTKNLDMVHLEDVSRVTDFIQITYTNNSVEVTRVDSFCMFCCKFRFDGVILVDRTLASEINEELFTYMRSVGFNILLIDIVD